MKPTLSWDEQVNLLVGRGLAVDDPASCASFMATNSYYRFSGYMRYYQRAPHRGDDRFRDGISFEEIREIYTQDERLRSALYQRLGSAELLLRTHTAHVIARKHHPYGYYLDDAFYVDPPAKRPTVEVCLDDLERSKERHITRFRLPVDGTHSYAALPVWSAVEAWSFGTLSRCVERGDNGGLSAQVAMSLGVATAGFAQRVKALVYLRNRCAHHSRLWNHSVVDSGPTPNNVRKKAKRIAGQFQPRSILDVVASLDDILEKNSGSPLLPGLAAECDVKSDFWLGLSDPQSPKDHPTAQ